MKHIFIINPVSGDGRSNTVSALVEQICNHTVEYDLRFTEYKGHATEIAREYTENDDVCLYSVGGDGTAHEILNGLQNGVRMAIIPVGSGNDYYTMIGSEKTKLYDTIKNTIEGKDVIVDYAYANNRRFLNCTNMGIDANINHRANIWGDRFRIFRHFKRLSYVLCAIVEIILSKTFSATLTIDGVDITDDYLLCSVMLGRMYGGGFKSTPDASIQDGYLDICAVSALSSRLKMFYLLPKYYQGKHSEIDVVTQYRGKHIRLKANQVITIGNDGEIYEGNDIEFRIVERGLILRVPQSSVLK